MITLVPIVDSKMTEFAFDYSVDGEIEMNSQARFRNLFSPKNLAPTVIVIVIVTLVTFSILMFIVYKLNDWQQSSQDNKVEILEKEESTDKVEINLNILESVEQPLTSNDQKK